MIVWEYGGLLDEYEVLGLVNFKKDKEFEDKLRVGIDIDLVPPMELITEEGNLKVGDFPYFMAGAPVFSERAMEAFKGLLAGKVKFLPFVPDGGNGAKYYVVQVTNVIDALDYKKTEIEYYPHDPSRRAPLDNFAFKREVVANQVMFGIPEARTRTFVTGEFIEKAKDAGLAGISFAKIWDSETGRKYPPGAAYRDAEVLALE